MSNVVPGPKHPASQPGTYTGGNHPRGHEQKPAKAGDPEGATAVGPDGLRHKGVQGYTVLGKCEHEAKEYGNLTDSKQLDTTTGDLLKD